MYNTFSSSFKKKEDGLNFGNDGKRLDISNNNNSNNNSINNNSNKYLPKKY